MLSPKRGKESDAPCGVRQKYPREKCLGEEKRLMRHAEFVKSTPVKNVLALQREIDHLHEEQQRLVNETKTLAEFLNGHKKGGVLYSQAGKPREIVEDQSTKQERLKQRVKDSKQQMDFNIEKVKELRIAVEEKEKELQACMVSSEESKRGDRGRRQIAMFQPTDAPSRTSASPERSAKGRSSKSPDRQNAKAELTRENSAPAGTRSSRSPDGRKRSSHSPNRSKTAWDNLNNPDSDVNNPGLMPKSYND